MPLNEITHRSGYVYLTIKPHPYYTNDLVVVKSTQNMPGSVPADAIVIKVRVSVPKKAFGPLLPTAVVEIPESAVIHPTVSVEAVTEEPPSD